MRAARVELWALDEVHFQQPGSGGRMWVPPENKDPIVYHHPTRKSVGYFGAVRLRDGALVYRRENGTFNGESCSVMCGAASPTCSIWAISSPNTRPTFGANS